MLTSIASTLRADPSTPSLPTSLASRSSMTRTTQAVAKSSLSAPNKKSSYTAVWTKLAMTVIGQVEAMTLALMPLHMSNKRQRVPFLLMIQTLWCSHPLAQLTTCSKWSVADQTTTIARVVVLLDLALERAELEQLHMPSICLRHPAPTTSVTIV